MIKKMNKSKMLKRTARQWSVEFMRYHYRVFRHKRKETELALEGPNGQLEEQGDHYNSIGKR